MKIQIEQLETNRIRVFVEIETKQSNEHVENPIIGLVVRYTEEASDTKVIEQVLGAQINLVDTVFKRYQISKLKKLTKKEITQFVEELRS